MAARGRQKINQWPVKVKKRPALTPPGMLVQEEFPNLMGIESDKEDLDFKISSDD